MFNYFAQKKTRREVESPKTKWRACGKIVGLQKLF